jgi:hypothetical protein
VIDRSRDLETMRFEARLQAASVSGESTLIAKWRTHGGM